MGDAAVTEMGRISIRRAPGGEFVSAAIESESRVAIGETWPLDRNRL